MFCLFCRDKSGLERAHAVSPRGLPDDTKIPREIRQARHRRVLLATCACCRSAPQRGVAVNWPCGGRTVDSGRCSALPGPRSRWRVAKQELTLRSATSSWAESEPDHFLCLFLLQRSVRQGGSFLLCHPCTQVADQISQPSASAEGELIACSRTDRPDDVPLSSKGTDRRLGRQVH